MFLIEYIVKKLSKKKEESSYNPISSEEREYEDCEHIYMPVDSTGETLSCTKCGTLCKKSDLKDELKSMNFFMQRE